MGFWLEEKWEFSKKRARKRCLRASLQLGDWMMGRAEDQACSGGQGLRGGDRSPATSTDKS